MNSTEENSLDFCPNHVQEFGLRQKTSLTYELVSWDILSVSKYSTALFINWIVPYSEILYDSSVQSNNHFVQTSFLRVGSGDNLLLDER